MMEALQFVLGDFWRFCGAVILLCIVGQVVIACVAIFRPTDQATYWRRAYEALVKQTGQGLQGPPA